MRIILLSVGTDGTAMRHITALDKITASDRSGGTEKSADAFRTISEVAEDLDLPQHVLRFWETRFSQIRPLKRAGGRRYYRPVDVALLRTIRQYLYEDGYTIKGVQRLLKDQAGRTARADAPLIGSADAPAAGTAMSASGDSDFLADDGSVGVLAPPRSDPFASSIAGETLDRTSVADRDALREALDTIEDCARILDAVLCSL